MAQVFFGLGSNIEPVANLALGLAELRERFGELRLSNVYQSKTLGFEGDDFLNMVVAVQTEKSPISICEEIGKIHDKSGRERGSARFVSRPLDIDLLIYDQLVENKPPVKVPRKDVLEYSFVLVPLAEIAPEFVHPVTGRTFSEHAREFDASCHPLTLSDVIL